MAMGSLRAVPVVVSVPRVAPGSGRQESSLTVPHAGENGKLPLLLGVEFGVVMVNRC
jgi:hypothetical protein